MDLNAYISDAILDASCAGVERWIGVGPSGAPRAVWVLKADATPPEREEFVARATSLQRLHHPAFGGDWHVDLSRQLVVASTVSGTPLPGVIVQNGVLDVAVATQLGQELAEAFIEAHSLGFTHGGLTPKSVFMSRDRTSIADLDPMFPTPKPDGVAADIRAIGEVLRFAAPQAGLGALGSIIDRACSPDPGRRFLSAVHMYGDLCDCARDIAMPDDALPWVHVGGWILERELGRGGFGRVFLAHRDGLRVALKVLMRGADQTSSDVRRFRREAEFAAALKSPGTIRLIEHGEDQGVFYIAFEYVDGETLSTRLDRGPLTSSDVNRMYRTLLDSLEEAHNLGILHRDIKPANIMIDADGNTKLLDFGIAKAQGDILAASTKLTVTGNVLGTPRYISPEALLGGQVTAASDLYSLGHVMYEALVGKPAVGGESSFHWISRHLDVHDFRLPIGPWSPGVVAAIEGSMKREPRDRPSTTAAVRALLDQVNPANTRMSNATPRSVSASTRKSLPDIKILEGPTERAKRFAVPTSVLVILLALVVAAIGTVVVVGLRTPDEVTPPPPARKVREAPPSLVKSVSEPVEAKASVTGCGAEPPFAGLGRLRALVGLDSLEWDVFVPPEYDSSRKYPTLIMFNGIGRTPSETLKQTGLITNAQQDGWVVIAVSNTTNTLTSWMTWDPEVALAALEKTRTELCLDPDRLFAFGHGSGGRAAESLPCVTQVAAVATSSFRGRQSGDPVCARAKAVPYLQLSPLRDGTSPVEGGSGCAAIEKQSLAAKEATWRQIHGCAGDEREISTPPAGRCVTWDCETTYEVCRLDGGRQWPGMLTTVTDLKFCDAEPAPFPYGETIWAFFNRIGGLEQR